ncbi:MAG TPA: CopG family transcriptional regulator [Thermoanaerobaculia bacterium]|nr:CopG family transcriptional regulator [Thermoanaerobaculia bacterium]
MMVRTQISLSEEEYGAAKREAKRLGISLAELLRRSLRGVLPADESKPWMRYAGMVESGDPHSSQHIDDVIYGQKD